ncbi:MAG: thiolase family protein [Candidatus Spechtbacteria bacterium]|nr:thiolase family protein [Candidatus Spechtbacteria bacterium]
MQNAQNVYIVEAARTPFGKFFGVLKDTPAPQLGARVVREMLSRLIAPFSKVQEIYLGEVLTSGVGQNPARQVAIKAGLSQGCHAVTVNEVCSSSLVAIRLAVQSISLGDAELVVAGGVENMSRAPYLLPRVKKTLDDKKLAEYEALPEAIVTDSMLYDGLRDVYYPGMPHMGRLADTCASVYVISRDAQEDFAFESFRRAKEATDRGYFDSRLVYVPVSEGVMYVDEGIRKPDMERMKMLKPVFSDGGTVTAATSSQISDGAAMVLLCSEKIKEELGLKPLARVVAYAMHSQNPYWYTTAPVGAIKAVLAKAELSLDQVDFFEINEAFAVVPIYAMRQLGIPRSKVNIWGGAIALGHPIGASGARLVTTLAYELRATGKRYGIAVACNGGGEAVAVLIENTNH